MPATSRAGAAQSGAAGPGLFRSCLAMASAAAGIIHLAAAPSHFGESALHGSFFLVAALFQLGTAALLVRSDILANPRLLGGVAATNLGFVAIWAMSRTTGLPIGPEAWTPEAVGLADASCSILEIALTAGAVGLLLPGRRTRLETFQPARSSAVLVATATALFVLTGFSVAGIGTEEHVHGGAGHAAHGEGTSLAHGGEATHDAGAHGGEAASGEHADGHPHSEPASAAADGPAGRHTHDATTTAAHAHATGADAATHAAHAPVQHADAARHDHADPVATSVAATVTPTQAIGPSAGDSRATVRYGPFVLLPKSLGGMLHVSLIQPTLARPCTNCYLTSVTPDLVYDDGRSANLDTGPMLHHAVWARPLVPDSTCGTNPVFGLVGERFFASGNERTPWVMPTGFGYYVGGDPWNLVTEIMNHSEELRIVFVKLDVTYRPAPDTRIKEVKPVWMDVANCSTSEYQVPAGMSETDWAWNSSLTGRIVATAGHLHDGGKAISLVNESTGTRLCTSAARYGTRAGSLGTLDSMTTCAWDALGTVRSGEVLGVRSTYDMAQPASDVMGIMLVYVHQTDNLEGGIPAPHAVTAPAVDGTPPPAHAHTP